MGGHAVEDGFWPPEEGIDGRRPSEGEAPAGASPSGSPWSQPPSTPVVQHGRPVPHVPAPGEPVRPPHAIPVSGSGAIPVSGSGAIPVSGSGAIPVSGPAGAPHPMPPRYAAELAAPLAPPGPPPAPPGPPGPPPAPPGPLRAAPQAPPHAPPGPPPQAPSSGPLPPSMPPRPRSGEPAHWPQPAPSPPPPPPAPSPPSAPPLPPMPPSQWGDGSAPTAEEFARRRQARPADPVAVRGMRGALAKGTLGLVQLPPGRREVEYRQDVERVRRNFGGLRQVTVVNPKGGAGKTVAVLLLAMTFGQKRGGYVLAWDNNETQGTLGMRAQQDFHIRTVRDLLRDLVQFQGAQGRVGDLSQYVRAQGEGMFDVLASDESATAGEMLTAHAFGEIRDVVSRFYKLIFVDTGNNVRAENWQAAIDATDQLVVTMSARNDSAETASRMLDHLEQHGRQRLVRQAVTVVSMPPSRRHVDIPAITRHFAARTRTVLLVPYERFIDSGEPIRYAGLSAASRDAWLKVAAAVSEGL
ncbi:chromosome partitioning protein [Dactylosporangium sp. AC04546]|uniref:MinD/ParA family ATP-binding protein n=1 Tax=Dactylosporangium sp. AC04546 TaxID=2862460 RepID=UPI003FA497D6